MIHYTKYSKAKMRAIYQNLIVKKLIDDNYQFILLRFL